MRALMLVALTMMSQISSATTILEKDLALILDTGLDKPIRVKDRLGDKSLMPKQWYERINQAFSESPVGTAIEDENLFEDWQIVSARIVPCNPLVRSTAHSPELYCWPEVRIVAQPVISKFKMKSGFIEEHYADDRAVHMLYDVPASLLGPQGEELQILKDLILEKRDNFVGTSFEPLDEKSKKRFIKLRNQLSSILMQDTLSLRQNGIPEEAYKSIGNRPELASQSYQSIFRSKLLDFLEKYNYPSNLKKLTGFSLPEGREPANSDQWIFVAFKPDGEGNIELENVPIFSMKDARKITELPSTTIGSMREDSAELYELDLDSPKFSELKKQVFLFDAETSKDAKKNILDPQITTVDNTSCASCHRLNDTLFNFHNLSKLETEEVNISRRVINDVKYDLNWLKKDLK